MYPLLVLFIRINQTNRSDSAGSVATADDDLHSALADILHCWLPFYSDNTTLLNCPILGMALIIAAGGWLGIWCALSGIWTRLNFKRALKVTSNTFDSWTRLNTIETLSGATRLHSISYPAYGGYYCCLPITHEYPRYILRFLDVWYRWLRRPIDLYAAWQMAFDWLMQSCPYGRGWIATMLCT